MIKKFFGLFKFFGSRQAKPSPQNILLGKRIKSIRKNANLSQSQFAKRLNVHRRTVSRWENGFNKPQTTYLKQIARVTGKGIIWLLYNEDYSVSINPSNKAA